ncbi:TolC family protein [bacterium]|nr:TolC family protein [bacterium]
MTAKSTRFFFCGALIFASINACAPYLFSEEAPATFSLKACLEYGLSKHPNLQQADGALKSAEAKIGQIRSGMGTKVNLQSSFNRQRQERRRVLTTSRISLSSDDLIDSSSNSLTVKKLLMDSGKTNERVKSGQLSLKAARYDKLWQEVLVASDIKAAYFKALQAKALIAVQEDALSRYQVHLDKVRSFVEIGVRPPYDITKAEVDVANSQVALIKAESDFRVALSVLAKTTGIDREIAVESTIKNEKPGFPIIDKETLLSETLQRFDLSAASCRAISTEHQIGEARKGLSPTLSGGAGYDWSGSVTPMDRSWNMNLSISVPFLDGRLTKFQIRDAEGIFQSNQAKVQQLKLAAKSDLEVAISGVIDSFKRLDATEILLRQTSETLKLAEGRYDAGVGSPIEITDARTSYSGAQGSFITAFYDSLISLTKLDAARGKLPEEINFEF